MSQSILLIVAFVALLLVVAAAVLVLRDPEATKRRVLAFFRRPSKAPKAPGADHYYRPYWS